MNYWFVWALNQGQFRDDDKWIDMKVDYLEDRLDFNTAGINYFTSLEKKKKTEGMQELFIGTQMGKIFSSSHFQTPFQYLSPLFVFFTVTRTKMNAIMQRQFSMPKVKILRKFPYEKYLLLKARKITRRLTIAKDNNRNPTPKPILKIRGKSLGGGMLAQQQPPLTAQQQVSIQPQPGPSTSNGTSNRMNTSTSDDDDDDEKCSSVNCIRPPGEQNYELN